SGLIVLPNSTVKALSPEIRYLTFSIEFSIPPPKGGLCLSHQALDLDALRNQRFPDVLHKLQRLGVIPMNADGIRADRDLISINRRNLSLFYHTDHAADRQIPVLDHRAGKLAGNQRPVVIVGPVREHL